MSISNEQLQRAITAARVRETQGYFDRVKAGDQKAASLFARLVAGDLNPSGKDSDFGWLSKQPGESQVDGFAEDAICFGSDPSDLQNVIDMVNGAGAPGASIGGGVHERRPGNKWVKPKSLTAAQLAYLLVGAVPHPPMPDPPQPPAVPPYAGDAFFTEKVGIPLHADYSAAGQLMNAGSASWFARTIYDIMAGMTPEASVAKHRPEWRAALGLPPL